jgi:hypothetical protein
MDTAVHFELLFSRYDVSLNLETYDLLDLMKCMQFHAYH